MIAVSVFAPGPSLRGPATQASSSARFAGSATPKKTPTIRIARSARSMSTWSAGSSARAASTTSIASPGCSMNSSVRASITAVIPRATGSVSAACARASASAAAVPRTNSAAPPSSSVSAERTPGAGGSA